MVCSWLGHNALLFWRLLRPGPAFSHWGQCLCAVMSSRCLTGLGWPPWRDCEEHGMWFHLVQQLWWGSGWPVPSLDHTLCRKADLSHGGVVRSSVWHWAIVGEFLSSVLMQFPHWITVNALSNLLFSSSAFSLGSVIRCPCDLRECWFLMLYTSRIFQTVLWVFLLVIFAKQPTNVPPEGVSQLLLNLYYYYNITIRDISPKTECGCPSGGGIKNGNIRYPLLWGNAEKKHIRDLLHTEMTHEYGLYYFPHSDSGGITEAETQ